MPSAIYWLIVSLAVYNILRVSFLAICSSLYDIKKYRKFRTRGGHYYPTITIVIPAHNEERAINTSLQSLQKSIYPPSRMRILVVDDGSTDDTAAIVERFASRTDGRFPVKLVRQPNRGKAAALNNALENFISSQLVMCLDADSTVDRYCIRNATQYFTDKSVVAVASNVNIVSGVSVLGLVQKIEYLLSHQLKKANTVLNMEYIIGGVGSTFRTSTLRQVGHYDSNTLTEDIDLTMKIIAKGNKHYRAVFAGDALTYTQPVRTFGALVKQRFRWKYGRLQSFYKNRRLFFSLSKNHSKTLTWYNLPAAVVYEVFNLLDIGLLVFILLNPNVRTLATLLAVQGSLALFCLWMSDHLSLRQKISFSVLAPLAHLLLSVITVVEYCAGLWSFVKLRRLKKSTYETKHTTWISPQRL